MSMLIEFAPIKQFQKLNEVSYVKHLAHDKHSLNTQCDFQKEAQRPHSQGDQLSLLTGDCSILVLKVPCPGDLSVPGKPGQLFTLQQLVWLEWAFLASLISAEGISLPCQLASGSQDKPWAALGGLRGPGILRWGSQDKGAQQGQTGPETVSGPHTFRLLGDRSQVRLQTEGQDQGEMEMVSEGPAGSEKGKELCSPR